MKSLSKKICLFFIGATAYFITYAVFVFKIINPARDDIPWASGGQVDNGFQPEISTILINIVWIIGVPVIALVYISQVLKVKTSTTTLIILLCTSLSILIGDGIIGNDFVWDIATEIGLRNSDYIDLVLRIIRMNLATTSSISTGILLILISRLFTKKIKSLTTPH